jgi:hypothetical protein
MTQGPTQDPRRNPESGFRTFTRRNNTRTIRVRENQRLIAASPVLSNGSDNGPNGVVRSVAPFIV